MSDWEGKLPEDSVARVTGVWKVSQQTGREQEAVICRWWAGVSGTVAVGKEASSHFPARVIFRPHSDSLRQTGLSLEAQSWLICITKNPRWKTGNERRD